MTEAHDTPSATPPPGRPDNPLPGRLDSLQPARPAGPPPGAPESPGTEAYGSAPPAAAAEPTGPVLPPAGWLMMARSVLFNGLFFFFTALCVLGGLLMVPPFPRRWLRVYVRGWAKLILWLLRVICGVRLQVTGRENLPVGAAVIAAKHQSAFDTVVWLALLPDAVYILKQELLRIPVWGTMARRYGAVAVNRTGGASALKQMVRDASAAAAEGSQIIIFPEGTRTAPGARVPYLPGVVALGAAVGRPIIPVATDSGLFWSRHSFVKRPGVLTVAIMPPLPQGLPRAALLARMQEVIETESLRLLPPGYAQPVDNSVG